MTAASPTIGQVFGHYRLLEQIGAGGMGVVFRAHDEKLRRDVAVKILPHSLFSHVTSREQFQQEALAVGRISHPNVAMAFDFGQENGVDYLVTEFVPGVNLDEKIEGQPLPPKTILELGMQVMSGLAAAHREHVIHRDLKPGNIRINRDGQLKILDFGLAQLMEPVDESAETCNLDTDLAISGTLPYMAPELLRAEPPDERVDVWAAGAVLYEMATGKRAFPEKQSARLIDSILHQEPVKPSLINPKITTSLQAVIMRALDRDLDRRYQSANEMYADLHQVYIGDEIATETLRRSSIVQLQARNRKRKLALILAAVLLAGVVLGYFVKRFWTPQQRILAVLPIDTVGQDAATNALGIGLMETLTAKLAQASDNGFLQIISARDLRDQGVKTTGDAQREFGSDLVLESSLQKEGQTIRVNTFLVDAKSHRQLASRTITINADDSFGLQDRVVSETLDMLPVRINAEERRKLAVRQDTKPAAYEAYMRGRGYIVDFSKPEDIDNAVSEFSRATEIDPNYALAYAALGKTYWAGFREFQRGSEWVTKATNDCEKALALNPDLVEGHICLGNVYNGTGQYEKGVEELQRALQSEPGNEDALRGLGDAYRKLGDLASAEVTYKKAVALRPHYWAVYNWLGGFYAAQNRYSDAAAMYKKVTELAPNNYIGYLNLGTMYLLEGRYQDAIDVLRRCAALRPTTDAYNNLGYAYILLGRYAEGIAALEQALKIAQTDWMNWGNLGDALYWSSSRRSEAADKYRKAVSMALSELKVNPQDATTLSYLAEYSAMLNDQGAALDYLQRALKAAPGDGDVLFRAAIVHNHFGQTDQALQFLQKAADVGYSKPIIRDTPDFAPFRQNPQFQALVGKP